MPFMRLISNSRTLMAEIRPAPYMENIVSIYSSLDAISKSVFQPLSSGKAHMLVIIWKIIGLCTFYLSYEISCARK